MRIAHVTDCYLPRVGGIELHVRDLAAHQRAAGHAVEVWTRTPAPSEQDACDRTDVVRRLAPLEPRGPVDTLAATMGDVRTLLRHARPDVVHAHVSVVSPLTTLTVRTAAAQGVPVLVTVHSLWSHFGPVADAAQLLLGLRRWPIAWSGVSDAAASTLRRILGDAAQVAVLHNAVDVDYWREVAPTPAVPTVASVLRFAHTKRPLALVRMLHDVRRLLPDDQPLQAVLVGEGPLRPRVERYLARHDMDSWVELPGRLDRDSVRDRLAQSSVYLSPSHLESFGIAPLEARSMGLPVVGSSRGGLRDVVADGESGLLGRDDGEMVQALVRLLAHPTYLAELTAANRRNPPVHTWARAVERSAELYAVAVARAGADRSAGSSSASVPRAS